MRILRSPIFLFLLAVIAILLLSSIGPREQSLGVNVRIVYLHGAWVLAAEAALGISALIGLLALLLRKAHLHAWSSALGRTGMFFWITYLPLSLWAMQANWNGLFLSEPRFRLAVIFAVTGLLLQLGLALLAHPLITSLTNLVFFITLRIGLAKAAYILHPPPSPIFSSGDLLLKLYFSLLIVLTLVAAYFMTRWWLDRRTRILRDNV